MDHIARHFNAHSIDAPNLHDVRYTKEEREVTSNARGHSRCPGDEKRASASEENAIYERVR